MPKQFGFIKKIDKNYAMEILKEAKRIIVYYDDKWNYPGPGDNQGNCPMLQMNFDVEKKPGFVIYIPADAEERKNLMQKIPALSHKDIFGENKENT